MKPNFIIPPVEKVIMGKEEYQNEPINLNLTSSIAKLDFKLAPFKDNCTKLPSIHFKGVDLMWIFEESDYELRDEVYSELMKQFGTITFSRKKFEI